MKNRIQKPHGSMFDFAIAVCVTIIIVLAGYRLLTYRPYQTGVLTIYDVYGNAKYTFQGDFEYKGNNQWYNYSNDTYYTFDNSIFEPCN